MTNYGHNVLHAIKLAIIIAMATAGKTSCEGPLSGWKPQVPPVAPAVQPPAPAPARTLEPAPLPPGASIEPIPDAVPHFMGGRFRDLQLPPDPDPRPTSTALTCETIPAMQPTHTNDAPAVAAKPKAKPKVKAKPKAVEPPVVVAKADEPEICPITGEPIAAPVMPQVSKLNFAMPPVRSPQSLAPPNPLQPSPFGGTILRPDLLTAKAVATGPRTAKLGELIEFTSEQSKNVYSQTWTIEPADTAYRTSEDGKRLFFASPAAGAFRVSLHVVGTGGDTDSAAVVVDYGGAMTMPSPAVASEAPIEAPQAVPGHAPRAHRAPTLAELLVAKMLQNNSPALDGERVVVISSLQALNAMIRSTHIGSGHELAAAMADRVKRDLGPAFPKWKPFFEELTAAISDLEEAGQLKDDEPAGYSPLLDNVVDILVNGR